MIDLLKIYWKLRLFHYGLFLGMTGGLATFIGPDRHHWIKLGIGITIGCMLLGNRFIDAWKALFKWTEDFFNDNHES